MKILHIITSLRTGGAEKLMVDLLPRLRAAGHEVDLLLFDGTMTPFRRQIESAGIRVFDLGVGGSVYSPVKFFKLLPYLKKYDVVHTHNTAPQLFAAAGSVLCSVVLCSTEHTTSNRRRRWKWYAPVDRWMYSRYRKVISISPKTEENLRAFINADDNRFVTISNGIDVKYYANASRAILPGVSQSFKIVQIAGFRYQKDQDTVIKAMALLPAKFELYLVGDGDRRSDLEKLVVDLNLTERVHFMGIRNDIPEMLSAADIAVMSSHWEGFGLAAVEAMAAGKPVVASDVEGLRDVVSGAGLLFAHEDSRALAEQIMELEKSPEKYADVARKCRERADGFDISTMAEGYLDVYQQLNNQ